MLNDFLSAFYLFWMHPVSPFHIVQYPLFFGACDPPAGGIGGAEGSNTAADTGRCGVVAHVAIIETGSETEIQPLTRRAEIAIAAFVVGEIVPGDGVQIV